MIGLAGKIPVRMERIAGGSVEVFMELDAFAETGASVRADIREFKLAYLGIIKSAKRADALAHAGRKVGTKQRWAACQMLADFDRDVSNKFKIMNYKEACARDLGIPLRTARVYLDFGSCFSDAEVIDEVPFTLYAELVFRSNALRRAGRLEAEKSRLVKMGRSGRLPARDAYRLSLRDIPAPRGRGAGEQAPGCA